MAVLTRNHFHSKKVLTCKLRMSKHKRYAPFNLNKSIVLQYDECDYAYVLLQTFFSDWLLNVFSDLYFITPKQLLQRESMKRCIS